MAPPMDWAPGCGRKTSPAPIASPRPSTPAWSGTIVTSAFTPDPPSVALASPATDGKWVSRPCANTPRRNRFGSTLTPGCLPSIVAEAPVQSFTYRTAPSHVVFGSGTIVQLPEVIRQIGGTRVVLLSPPQQAAQVEALGSTLGSLAVAYFCDATMHTPVDVTERAMHLVRAEPIDVVVALGGGWTIGLGKAIALRSDVPQIAIPTTYAGSEMTPILGQTENGRKTTQRSAKVMPRAVIYDVELTLGLPVGLSGTSGINAIAHAAEGLYAQDSNPVMQLIAEEGIRALAEALPRIAKEPGSRAARSQALYGAWLCGMVLGNVGMALHHKLCHTVGGRFDLPHAETHAIILPHVIGYNAP